MVGPPKGEGSMPLPHISGFSEKWWFSHKLPAEREHLMSKMLGNKRYQKGNRAARSYANLVVLFRMMLFYKPLRHHANEAFVRGIADFYADARYAALGASEQRICLLVRLVDEWLLIRPLPEIGYTEEVELTEIQATRSAWFKVRDYHVDVLMNSSLPACLAGVELPAKAVTSLWEVDPELVAIMKEVRMTRKPKRSTNRVGGGSKLPVIQAQLPAGPKLPAEPRQKASSLSEGDIDERESALTSNVSTFDARCFTPIMSVIQAGLPWHPSADQARKRSQTVDGVLEDYYAAESSSAFDLIDLTSPVLPSSPPAREPIPPPPPPLQQQNLPKLSPVLVQSKLTQFASKIPANDSSSTIASSAVASSAVASSAVASSTVTTTVGAWEDRRRDLSTELHRIAWQTRRWQADMRARVEAETTGCVPTALHGPGVDATGGHLDAAERELYESRLREIETRVVALETAHRDEVAWSRAMGRFLYDANDRSVRALQDAFLAIDTLQRASSALLDEGKRR